MISKRMTFQRRVIIATILKQLEQLSGHGAVCVKYNQKGITAQHTRPHYLITLRRFPQFSMNSNASEISLNHFPLFSTNFLNSHGFHQISTIFNKFHQRPTIFNKVQRFPTIFDKFCRLSITFNKFYTMPSTLTESQRFPMMLNNF